MVRKILVPIDFSETSMVALACAREIAATTRAELVVLHVLELPVMPVGDLPYFSMDVCAELTRSERQKLEKVVEELRQHDVCARGILHVGLASETILDCAREEQPQLIVVGTHGRHGVARVFLGSVAECIARRAPVPVLTVRGKERPPRAA